MWNYTDKVMDHFMNPRNVGEIADPDGVAEVGNAACGDALKLTFKLDENGSKWQEQGRLMNKHRLPNRSREAQSDCAKMRYR